MRQVRALIHRLSGGPIVDSPEAQHGGGQMTTTDAIRDRALALTRELKTLLMRMERPDLAAQMDAFTIRREERSRLARRRTFFADTAPRTYSLEIDLPGSVVILDIDAAQRIVALHVLEGID